MLSFLWGRGMGRKRRLFACGLCRRIWDWLWHPASRRAVEVSEQYADRADGWEAHWELTDARTAAVLASSERPLRRAAAAFRKAGHWVNLSYEEVVEGLTRATWAAAVAADETVPERAHSRCPDPAFQAELLRDLVRNPFRERTPIAPSLLTLNGAIVARLAQAAYEGRTLPQGTLDNARLLILADAVEEAGSTDSDLLEHLRSGREHWRGCWALDAILGRCWALENTSGA
jgi:hypothetical protein